jgi:MFS family permease
LTEIVITSSLVLGSGVILLFATGMFPIAVAAAAVTGFAMIVGTIGTQILIQGTVAEEYRGRVLGLFGMVFRAAPAIGALAMGWLSDFYGLHLPLMIGAGLCLIVWLAARRRGPSIRAFTEPAAQPAAE